MKSVLYCTDFTEKSINAFDYAVDYAVKSGSKLIVFHAYNPEDNGKSDIQEIIYSVVDIENFRNKKDKFPLFEQIIAKKGITNLKIKYIVKEGPYIEGLTEYIEKKDDKINVVIVGAHAKTNGILDMFTKPKALRVLDLLNKPVIAVPNNAKFDGSLNNFVFLVDYQDNEKEALEKVIEQSQEFNSNLHVIHFDLAHGEDIVPMMDTFKKSLANHNKENVIFKSIDSINIKQSLHEYCDQYNIDIVCLITHRRNSYQRLFSYSLAEDLLASFDIPIMAIYAD